MKKLMIAAAIVCAAVAAHAAAFSWQINEYNGVSLPVGDDCYQGMAYLMKSGTGSTGEDLLDAFNSEKQSLSTALATFYANYGLNSATTDEYGELAKTSFTANIEAGTTLTAYFAALWQDTEKGEYYLYISNEKSGTAQPSSTPNLAYAEAAASSADWHDYGDEFDGAGWYKVAVQAEPTPEPTSAMLLLLGVAGLALKRKQK